MNTEYDTKPEIMRLLNLFGKFKIYYDKDLKDNLSCTYWRGYLYRHKDGQLFKGRYLYNGFTGEEE